MNPLVSVIMATYNRANLAGRAIQSVIDQNFSDWELIVVNDASSDNTKDVLEEWEKKDKRIKVVNNEKNVWQSEGVAGNLRRGIALSSGKYIARIDDDDYWTDKNKLKKQIDFLKNHKDYVLCGTGVIVEDEYGKEIFRYLKREQDNEIREKALFANPFTHSTVLFLKTAYDKAGGYGNLKLAEDWDLWLKLGRIGKFYNLPEYSIRYLADRGSYSFIYQRAQSKLILKIIKSHRKNYPNFYPAYLLNYLQYLYSFLPAAIKKPLHAALSRIKRSI